jgi:hypothetical protein
MPLLAEITATGPNPYLYLIVLVGSGGIISAFIALFKLRGDRNSQVVSQAVGAMETMDTLLDALKDSLARANESRDFYRRRVDELEAELEKVNRRWGPFPIDEEL